MAVVLGLVVPSFSEASCWDNFAFGGSCFHGGSYIRGYQNNYSFGNYNNYKYYYGAYRYNSYGYGSGYAFGGNYGYGYRGYGYYW